MRHWIAIVLAVIGLAACGGGSSGGPSPSGASSPSGLSYPSAPAFTIGSAISPLSPTVVGTVTGYSVNPALPAGLSLSTGTGVISGTPTTIAAAKNYAITATNSSGSTQAVVSIVVNDVAPNISYASPKIEFATGMVANDIQPIVNGGAVVAWSVAPPLPAGLTLSATTGVISGSPTTDSAVAAYTITATNSGGHAAASLTIEVTSSELLELGETSGATLRLAGDRVLSEDRSAHWNLRAYSTGALLAAGDGSCLTTSCGSLGTAQVDMEGQNFIIETKNGLQVRAATDGHLLATIPGAASWWKLASDGTYVSVGNTGSLSVFSTSGQTLFSQSGDYSNAVTFAAPGQVQVANGPAGANVIQTVSVPGGVSSLSPQFHGQFSSWFVDGGRFLSNTGDTVWVYSSAGLQQDLASLPSVTGLTGQGSWFWTADSTLNVYAVGASASPAATFSFLGGIVGINYSLTASGPTIAVVPYGSPQLTIIDLSGATPARADYSLPIAYLNFGAFAAVSASTWIVVNGAGATLDGASLSGSPRFLTLGAVRSIAGSGNGVALSTSTGSVLVLDPRLKTTIATIPFNSGLVAMSADGSVLAAMGDTADAQYMTDRSLRVYSLPTGTQISAWPYAYGGNPTLVDMTLSASGTVIGQVLSSSREVTAVTGGSPIWSDSKGGGALSPSLGFVIELSPDGTLIAANDSDPCSLATSSVTATDIYKNGQLVAAVPGVPAGWIDNNRLLVGTYELDNHQIYCLSTGTYIYDASGNLLSPPPLASSLPGAFQTVSADAIYSPALNQILSLTTGKVLWMSANTQMAPGPPSSIGAVAGSNVVFSSGTKILVQPQ